MSESYNCDVCNASFDTKHSLGTHKGKTHGKPYDDPKEICRLYWDEGLTQAEIAAKFDVAQRTIGNVMERYGIKARFVNGPYNLPVRTSEGLGYEQIKQDKENGKTTTVGVHQLLAIADGADPFKIFSNGEYEVHHKNGIPWDNRKENLEVLTIKQHRRKHNKVYTEEELLNAIHKYVDENGEPPAIKTVSSWDGPSQRPFRRVFGKVSDAIREAGYTPKN